MSLMLQISLSVMEKTYTQPSRSITNVWHLTNEAKKAASSSARTSTCPTTI